MSPTTIIDLDDILGADKQVRVRGTVYTLPPDLPVELYLKIQRLAGQEITESEMIETLYEEILSLFRYKKPGLKELPLTLAQVVLAISRIYGGGDDGEADAAPPPATRGGRSTKSRSRTGSRS